MQRNKHHKMFNNLKKKWNVNGLQLFLIICTFAIGGSLCGRVGKYLLDKAEIQNTFLYVLLYILLITLLWPIAVLLVSIVFGQFPFFIKYIQKIKNRFF